MNWLTRWLSDKPTLGERQQRRLQVWQARPKPALSAPLTASRCVVVDVETSGLNLLEDRLISIGAVAVVNGKIVMSDSFSVVLQQAQASSRDNILLHGIGGDEQTEGVPAADALLAFLEFLGKDPLVAFHVTFDETMIRRAINEYLGLSFKHAWVDLAYVMPALNPSLASRFRSLDDWIGNADISNDARHNALADALVTAQLLQVALAQACRKRITDFSALMDLEKNQRWVSGVS